MLSSHIGAHDVQLIDCGLDAPLIVSKAVLRKTTNNDVSKAYSHYEVVPQYIISGIIGSKLVGVRRGGVSYCGARHSQFPVNEVEGA